MTGLMLKHIDRFTDRHGKPRIYYRCGKGRRVRLHGEPGSPEFMEAYRRAAEVVVDRAPPSMPAAVNSLAKQF